MYRNYQLDSITLLRRIHTIGEGIIKISFINLPLTFTMRVPPFITRIRNSQKSYNFKKIAIVVTFSSFFLRVSKTS